MFLYIKTNILRGYGIFKNDFAHPREPANIVPFMIRLGLLSRLDIFLLSALYSQHHFH